MIEVVAQPVVIEVVSNVGQASRPQRIVAGQALMLEVMDGVAHPLPVHAGMSVLLEQQHRHQPGLPVVAMDNVRPPVVLEQEFQRRLAEKGEAADIILEAVEMTAIEEVVRGMRLNEKALAALDKAKPDRAVDSAVIPRHPQILHADLQAPNLVITHAVILGQDDMDFIATDFQFPAEAINHVRQPADFRHRGAFGSNLHNVHKLSPFFIVFRAQLWQFSPPATCDHLNCGCAPSSSAANDRDW